MTQTYTSQIILASSSPRRKQLLAKAGYQFSVVHPELDESAYSAEQVDSEQYARRLALAKAKSIAEKHPESLVISADTIVDFQGEIIGKPADAKDARQIIQKLFGAPHRVITGLAICRLNDDTEMAACDITTIFPRQITEEQINEYIKSGLWKEKSGAYAIKEDGDEFVEKIEGSLTNVMGLPMELLERLLGRIFSRQ
jgi:septum formation protein